MKTPSVFLALGQGWECLIELQHYDDGSCNGRADVLCQGERRCVLVALNESGLDDALERLTRGATTFMDQATCSKSDGD